MKPSKYNPIYRASIIELYSEGYSIESIAKHCLISRQMLHVWIKKHNLKSIMDEARSNRAKESIEKGLDKLAKGAKDETTTDKFTYVRKAKRTIIDDFGDEVEEEYYQPVERTVVRKTHKPDSKAIEILSRKYAKEFDNKAEEREINTRILEGFTMRELQEARKNSPIDAGQFIEASFKELSTVTSGVDNGESESDSVDSNGVGVESKGN